MLFCAQRWLQLVLDMMVAGLAVLLMALAFSSRSATSAGLLGVALNNILNFSQSLSAVITSWTSLETSLGAIARIRSFAAATPAEPLPSMPLPPSWPTRGCIELRDVTVRYGDTDRPALESVNLTIEAGQKVGICGRTGSGKSTLMGVILGLVPFSGSVLVDDIDIRDVEPDVLRERLTAISQETFTLAGSSVRMNIDPSLTASKESIEAALITVGVWDQVVAHGGGLDDEMPALSAGEMQLFFLARALLRDSKIVILDEATSRVDAEKDKVVQELMGTRLREQTVITIAHKVSSSTPIWRNIADDLSLYSARDGYSLGPDRPTRRGEDRRKRQPGESAISTVAFQNVV